MLAIPFRGLNISVLFHKQHVDRLTEGGLETVDQIRCGLFADGAPLAIGYATRASRDPEDDYRGMKVAFARAVDRLTKRYDTTGEERGALWDAWRASGLRPAKPTAVVQGFAPPAPKARVIDFATQKRILAMKEELVEWERQHRASRLGPLTEKCSFCQQRRAAIAALETA